MYLQYVKGNKDDGGCASYLLGDGGGMQDD